MIDIHCWKNQVLLWIKYFNLLLLKIPFSSLDNINPTCSQEGPRVIGCQKRKSEKYVEKNHTHFERQSIWSLCSFTFYTLEWQVMELACRRNKQRRYPVRSQPSCYFEKLKVRITSLQLLREELLKTHVWAYFLLNWRCSQHLMSNQLFWVPGKE